MAPVTPIGTHQGGCASSVGNVVAWDTWLWSLIEPSRFEPGAKVDLLYGDTEVLPIHLGAGYLVDTLSTAVREFTGEEVLT